MTDLACRQCRQWKEERQRLKRPMSVGLNASVHRPTAIKRRHLRSAESCKSRSAVWSPTVLQDQSRQSADLQPVNT